MRETGSSNAWPQRVSRVLTIAGGLAACLMVGLAHGQAPLGRYHVEADNVTVSGISSGGYMAVQLGVAYSSVFSGVGVFAAGPFACADAGDDANVNARRALGPCMAGRYELAQRIWCNLLLAICPGIDAPDAEASIRLAREKEASHQIDPLANVTRQRIFLLAGKDDKKVIPEVVDAAARFYEAFDPPPRIKYADATVWHTVSLRKVSRTATSATSVHRLSSAIATMTEQRKCCCVSMDRYTHTASIE